MVTATKSPASARLDWDLAFAQMLPITSPIPDTFRRKLETGVTNGDCLPACFAAMLECFHLGHIESTSLTAAAGNMRKTICDWIKKNWEECPVFNKGMKVCEIIRLLHDFSIPESERKLRGEWGDDPLEQLVKYNELCDKLYFSDAEMLMFSSMMWERRRLPVVFRVFRVEADPTVTSMWKGSYQTTTPDLNAFLDVTKSESALLIDVAHVGTQDGWGAHYKLLISSSLEGLTRCQQSGSGTHERSVPPNELLPNTTRRQHMCNVLGPKSNNGGGWKQASKRRRSEAEGMVIDL